MKNRQTILPWSILLLVLLIGATHLSKAQMAISEFYEDETELLIKSFVFEYENKSQTELLDIVKKWAYDRVEKDEFGEVGRELSNSFTVMYKMDIDPRSRYVLNYAVKLLVESKEGKLRLRFYDVGQVKVKQDYFMMDITSDVERKVTDPFIKNFKYGKVKKSKESAAGTYLDLIEKTKEQIEKLFEDESNW